MTLRKLRLLPIAALPLLAACATVPTGPSVMVLPGNGKDFEQFRYDDAVCRQFAVQQTGTTRERAAAEKTLTGAAVGTVLGAAAGAAVGAAAGDPGTGAAVGSGIGLLAGTSEGVERAERSQWALQRRYDMAYMQCMYAKGNRIPVPAGSQLTHTAPPRRAPSDVPPPPPGSPPPPPPGAYDR